MCPKLGFIPKRMGTRLQHHLLWNLDAPMPYNFKGRACITIQYSTPEHNTKPPIFESDLPDQQVLCYVHWQRQLFSVQTDLAREISYFWEHAAVLSSNLFRLIFRLVIISWVDQMILHLLDKPR